MKASDESEKSEDFDVKLDKMRTSIFYELAGPRVLPLRYTLNFFKATTFLWILLLMQYFQNYTPVMYLYLFMAGSYGIGWVIKDLWFPDASFMQKASIASHAGLGLFLATYWMIPVPLAAGYGISSPSTARTIAILVIYLLGMVLMFGADYQKTTTLRHRKGLISDGFFKYSRNPNYLGETLIYTSFVLNAGHILGFVIFYVIGGSVFALGIYLKDKMSFEKKVGWEEYRKLSYIFLPKIFATLALNTVFYLCLFIGLVYFFAQETPTTFLYPFISQ